MEKGRCSANRPIFEWSQLTEDNLREEIKRRISGFGMSGSTAHFHFVQEYHKEIEHTEIKQKVDKILLEFIDDINDTGDRAIYICSDLQLKGTKEKILAVISKADKLFERIAKARLAKDWSIYIEYLRELNTAVYRLNITEAKDFLVKQIGYLSRKQVLEPMTKEFYLHHLAQSALESLKKVDPRFSSKYERNATLRNNND